ncbi:MAG: hypothetical protein RL701_4384 [Pseudomonadota bacterium]
MDTTSISARPNSSANAIGNTTPVDPVASTPPAADTTTTATTADAPATTHHLSRGGFFLNMLQAYEDKHPEEAKAFLSGVADKLRNDAQHAGPFANRLNAWADKFQEAADTGDLSKLVPTRQAHGHFGMRAYMQAAHGHGAHDDGADIGSILGNAPPVPTTTASTTTTTTKTTTTTTTTTTSTSSSTGTNTAATDSAAASGDSPVPDTAVATHANATPAASDPDAASTDTATSNSDQTAIAA